MLVAFAAVAAADSDTEKAEKEKKQLGDELKELMDNANTRKIDYSECSNQYAN